MNNNTPDETNNLPQVNAKEFLTAIFDLDNLPEDEHVCITLKSGNNGSATFRNYLLSDQVLSMIDRQVDAAYFCISTVRTPAAGGNARRRREDLQYLMLIGFDDIFTKCKPPPLEPSYELETSDGNFQWGCFIEPVDMRDPAQLAYAEKCIDAIAEAGYSDPGAKGSYRVLRVPGARHKTGFIARVTSWHPERVWTLPGLMQALGIQSAESRTVLANGGVRRDGYDRDAYIAADPVFAWLDQAGMVTGNACEKYVEIVCPWASEHTTGGDVASYTPAGHHIPAYDGAFHCFHAHCKGRNKHSLIEWVVAHSGQSSSALKPTQPKADPVFKGPRMLPFDPSLAVVPPPIPELIPDIIPREVFGLFGPGGSSKSTIALWLSMRLALGIEVLGHTQPPCRVLILAGEDRLDIFYHRMHRLARGMGFLDEQWRQVLARVFIEDVTGETVRLIEPDSDGRLMPTSHVDDLIDAYQDTGVDLVWIDPTSFFGPGERYVNDAEIELMRVGRKISTGLGGAAVGFVHHVSKGAARAGLEDQYASRGGSAFADNSRGQISVTTQRPPSKRDPEDTIYPPLSITAQDPTAITDKRVIRFAVAKYSHGRPLREPVWIVRGRDDPFVLSCTMPLTAEQREADEEERAARDEARQEKLMAAAEILVLQTIQRLNPNGDQPLSTRRLVEDSTLIEGWPLKASSRKAVSLVLQRTKDAGWVQTSGATNHVRTFLTAAGEQYLAE